MKTLIIFLCSLATSPDCYKDPEIITVTHDSSNLCYKIEEAVVTASLYNKKIHPFNTKSWLIGYDCGDGAIFIPLHNDDGMNE